jgi:glycosyltransferase involved in cell wall biosynthesis
MKIGIDASRAFENNRTGIEEYSYQVIEHLISELKEDQVILYVKTPPTPPLELPNNWRIKIIRFPYLWTQIGLSLELLFHPVDALFVPAHVVPVVHPVNTFVTIHGLEYEFCPKAYSWWARLYMRWSIKKSCRWAKIIIAVSQNTKKDLVNLYKVPEGKIEVIYEGVGISSSPLGRGMRRGKELEKIIKPFPSSVPRRDTFSLREKGIITGNPYLLFIGRLEERKNIIGIIKAFEILKEKYKIPHKLVLAGKPGFGYEKIKKAIKNYKFEVSPRIRGETSIIELGYIDEEEKWEFLKNADVFLFPTFYEGFGLPILEAQSVGVPVVASNNSSIPEVVNPKAKPSASRRLRLRESNSALLVNPKNTEEIAEAVYKLISDKVLRDDIINRGYENMKRFSWEKCAEKVSALLLENKKDLNVNK